MSSSVEIAPTIIDSDIFGQLLEMDEEADRTFSKEIVWNYFEQAHTTVDRMDDALAKKSLSELSHLGHFLKGSSAAVGVIKVRESCERMQHYGMMREPDGISELSESDALSKVTKILEEVKFQYKEAETALTQFYGGAESD